MQVQQWASFDFNVLSEWGQSTALLSRIDPRLTVVTNISVTGTEELEDQTSSAATIESITFSDGSVRTLNVPSFMELNPVPSNIVNILYKIEVLRCDANATVFFLGLL